MGGGTARSGWRDPCRPPFHYDLAVPPDARDATARALALHVQGCPAHQSVKDAIQITWDAAVRVGDQTTTLREGTDAATT